MLDGRGSPAEPDRVGSEATAHLVGEQQLELASMHRQLRPVVAGLGAARLAPDELAEPIDVREAAGRHADRGHRVAEAQLGQFPHRMREEVDADAQRPQLLCALDHGDVGDSRTFEAQGGRETADSGTDDDDLHTASLLM